MFKHKYEYKYNVSLILRCLVCLQMETRCVYRQKHGVFRTYYWTQMGTTLLVYASHLNLNPKPFTT
jgi:hypothetical protein